MSKVLVLKNDRAGDLFTSLSLISTLIRDEKNVKIYLSEFNISFNFFFKKIETKKINFNLNLIDKINILIDIFKNKYDKIYILTPKSFYFFLPFFFKNIKFYGIVYDGKNRKRPNNFLRKFLYKYEVLYRNKLNKYSYRQLQEKLLEKSTILDKKFLNLTLPNVELKYLKFIPNNYIFFQFRYKFFEDLNWDLNKFKIFVDFLKKKYENVLFCSDIEKNSKTNFYNNYFQKNYSTIDLNSNLKFDKAINSNIFFLKDLSGIDMFYIIKKASLNIAKEGIVSHISFFHNVKCHNLFNFKLISKEDVRHQKISYSEWCKGMNFKFTFLNDDLEKTIKKLKKQI